MSFEADAREYALDLDEEMMRVGVPRRLLRKPDHIAVGVTNRDEYVWLAEEFVHKSRRIAETEVDNGRKVAAVELIGSVVLLDVLWPIKWVEIIETEKNVAGIEHMVFVVTDLEDARQALTRVGIEHEKDSNPNHAWLKKAFSGAGPEFRLTDRSLEDIVDEELRTGESRLVWHEDF